MATITTNNYRIGGCDIYFDTSVAHASLLATNTAQQTVGSPFRVAKRNMGNIVTQEFSPDVTYIEHYISKNGSRSKDLTQVNNKAITIPFTFDEINGTNLKRFFLGSNIQAGNKTKIAIMQEALRTGSVSLLFRTAIGRTFAYTCPKAVIRPDGAMALNVEDWWTAPMVLEVLYYDTGEWASKPYGLITMNP